MTAKVKKVKTEIIQFDKMQEIFQAALKELFINPASCEETELHYFSIEKSENEESICYDDHLLPASVTENKTAAGYKQFIKDYIQNTLKKTCYVLEESETYNIDNDKEKKVKFRVFWVFCSECLDSNNGKMLLKCVFQKLADVFNQCVKDVIDGIQSESQISDSGYVGVTQKILNGAEAQAALNMQGLFSPLNIDFIDNLSGEYYEKSACESNMIFLSSEASKHLKPEDFLYGFSEIEFIPSNRRLIRKLMQITQNKLYLVLEADERENIFYVVGICTKSVLFQKLKNGNDMSVPYIRVNIKRHMQWDIFLGDTYIFTSINGHYKVDRKLREEFMTGKLKEYFGGTEENYNDLFKNIHNSTEQTHGTMFVIMEPADALFETQRLGDKQYGLPAPEFLQQKCGEYDRKELIEQEINHLNAIDGCVIFGTDGNLYGIGMILDGIAEKRGSPARGARYNSALKYLTYLKKKSKRAMILVISEDGSVDIFTTDDISD